MRNRYRTRQSNNCRCTNNVHMMPSARSNGGCAELPLAIATVPMQKWRALYEPCEALTVGTIFSELNLPYRMGGCRK